MNKIENITLVLVRGNESIELVDGWMDNDIGDGGYEKLTEMDGLAVYSEHANECDWPLFENTLSKELNKLDGVVYERITTGIEYDSGPNASAERNNRRRAIYATAERLLTGDICTPAEMAENE